jgi:dUTP pyrophosphatase
MKKKCSYVKIKKLSERAIIPTRKSNFAAGLDLHTAYDYNIPPNSQCIIKTDLQMSFPRGTYGRIAVRSSVALNQHVNVVAGVIDSDYRGNICIVVFNHSNNFVNFNTGDRIAQIICEKIKFPRIKEVDKLSETKRNQNGFGSTGK